MKNEPEVSKNPGQKLHPCLTSQTYVQHFLENSYMNVGYLSGVV